LRVAEVARLRGSSDTSEGGDPCVLLRASVAWRRMRPFPSEATKPMSRRRQDKAVPPGLAAETGPEDGADPRAFPQKPWDAPKQAGRKARQLCNQVKDALHGAPAACADGALQGR